MSTQLLIVMRLQPCWASKAWKGGDDATDAAARASTYHSGQHRREVPKYVQMQLQYGCGCRRIDKIKHAPRSAEPMDETGSSIMAMKTKGGRVLRQPILGLTFKSSGMLP